MSTHEEKYQEFEKRKNAAELGGGIERIEKQHKIGKRTVAWLQSDVYDWMNEQMA